MLFLKYTQRTALIYQLLHIQLCILLKECILRLPIVTQRPESNKCNRNLFSVITWIFEEMRYDLWSGSFPRKYGVHHLITFQAFSMSAICRTKVNKGCKDLFGFCRMSWGGGQMGLPVRHRGTFFSAFWIVPGHLKKHRNRSR